MIPHTAEPGLDEETAEFVAIEPEGAGLGIDLGPADVGGGVASDFPDERDGPRTSGGRW